MKKLNQTDEETYTQKEKIHADTGEKRVQNKRTDIEETQRIEEGKEKKAKNLPNDQELATTIEKIKTDGQTEKKVLKNRDAEEKKVRKIV